MTSTPATTGPVDDAENGSMVVISLAGNAMASQLHTSVTRRSKLNP